MDPSWVSGCGGVGLPELAIFLDRLALHRRTMQQNTPPCSALTLCFCYTCVLQQQYCCTAVHTILACIDPAVRRWVCGSVGLRLRSFFAHWMVRQLTTTYLVVNNLGATPGTFFMFLLRPTIVGSENRKRNRISLHRTETREQCRR